MASFHVEIVAAERQVFSGDAVMVSAVSSEGHLGIMPGHQPILLGLDIAPLTLELTDGTTRRAAVHEGFLFYSGDDQLVVLADVAEMEEEIDAERARSRRAAAEGREDEAAKKSLRKQDVRLQVMP